MAKEFTKEDAEKMMEEIKKYSKAYSFGSIMGSVAAWFWITALTLAPIALSVWFIRIIFHL